jgi:hypothetical protein
MIALSWAQSRMTAARAAIILTLEPAAAAVTAAILGAELGTRTVIGGALLVGAMLVVELHPRWPGLPIGRSRPVHVAVRTAGRPRIPVADPRWWMAPRATAQSDQLIGAGRELPGT